MSNARHEQAATERYSTWDAIVCPVCKTDEFESLFELAGEPFVRCAGCGLTLINPRRPFEQIRAGYDAAYSGGYIKKADKKLKRARRRVARLTREYRLTGSWLDVGCSAGFVVLAAQNQGFEAWGVDVEEAGIEYARTALGLKNLACGLLHEQDYGDAQFDAISVYDVIEHVPDLNGFVAELKRILKPDGVVEIGTPDIGHWRVPKVLSSWNEVKPSEHLYYFDRITLTRLLANHGLEVIRSRLALKPGLKIVARHSG